MSINYLAENNILLEESFLKSDADLTCNELIVAESPLNFSQILTKSLQSINKVEENDCEKGRGDGSLIYQKVKLYETKSDILKEENNSDDELENFFQKLRIRETPITKPAADLKDFIVSDSEDDVYESTNEDEYEKLLEYGTNNILMPDILSTPIIKAKKGKSYNLCYTEIKPRIVNIPKKLIFYAADDHTYRTHDSNEQFLDSLSLGTNKYTTSFNRHKLELVQRLYDVYNREIFSNQLPPDLTIKWNVRLIKTAGQCYYKRTKINVGSELNPTSSRKEAWIELSTKVCDSACRVRDVLLHEMCHAVAWLVSDYKLGHGPPWKKWAHKCHKTFPNLPLIKRCHNYDIVTKYLYRCTECGREIGRHSKSLDPTSESCHHCGGIYTMLVWDKKLKSYQPYSHIALEEEKGAVPDYSSNNPTKASAIPKPVMYDRVSGPVLIKSKKVNPFALYVKENYGSVRQNMAATTGLSTHIDTMLTLSATYRESRRRKNNVPNNLLPRSLFDMA